MDGTRADVTVQDAPAKVDASSIAFPERSGLGIRVAVETLPPFLMAGAASPSEVNRRRIPSSISSDTERR